jgi:aspartate carbamoyltransferase regulatory subunit
MKKELKVSAIKNGTVIDHIPAGKAFEVARILGLEDFSAVVSLAINVISGKSEKKDIIKIENRELSKEEVDRISLVAPNVTVNIVQGYEVTEKKNVEIPREIVGILSCSNPNCITRAESVKTKFLLEREDPLRIRCYYCERVLTEEDLKREITGE